LDDNLADAINMNFIGRTFLGWQEPANAAQAAVLEALRSGPKPKVKKVRKKKEIAHAA
jgi:hypothetical protein